MQSLAATITTLCLQSNSHLIRNIEMSGNLALLKDQLNGTNQSNTTHIPRNNKSGLQIPHQPSQ
jgi:hypothetical protein